MTLVDRLRAAQEPVGPDCTVGASLRAMPPALRAEYEAALADRHWYATKIAALMREDGHDVREHAVRRHRNGACACRA